MSDAEPPADPRLGWDLPPFGEMPTVHRVSELATRVLAPNPSPMTLDGTNTYVIADPGDGGAVVLDPGPEDEAHLERVETVLRDRDLDCAVVLVTHHHLDHAAAARPWAERFGCRITAPTPEVAGGSGHVVAADERIRVGALWLEAVATPGHTRDHTAYRAPDGSLFTGDHVLGRGTSVVAHPDGDLEAYLDSLRRVLALGPDRLFPGHGPELDEDPTAVVDYYLAHRGYRQAQVLATLDQHGRQTPRQLVERIYADVDPVLWDAAEASTRAALELLAERERVGWNGDEAWLR